MPGLPSHNNDAVNNGCGFSVPRCADETCGQQSRAQLSPDEELTHEECLALYDKPVMLYNIIQQRAIKNPSSLQRCLCYKIEAKRKKRIQISVSISGSANTELPAHGIFPLHVLFARATTNDSLNGHSPVYQFSWASLLTSFSESGNSDHTKATFTIPDLKSFATLQVCNLNIILISCGQRGKNLNENFSRNHVEYSSPQKLGGQCSWGKIPMDLLSSSFDNCVTLSLGQTVELTSGISMNPGFIEPMLLENDTCFTFCSQKADATGSYELQVRIDAQEAGARDTQRCPYSSYSYDDVPLSSLPDIIRLRTGNVLFNYRHCKKVVKREVTEDFSCSICLVKCGSFKGLAYHLTSSHWLFHCDFGVFEECQVVNLSLKVDARRAELLSPAGEGDEPSKKMFFYRSRFKKRCRRLETSIEKTKHVHPHIRDIVESRSPENIRDIVESRSPENIRDIVESRSPENIRNIVESRSPGNIRDIVESRSPGNMGHVHAHTAEPGSSKDAHKGFDVDYVPNKNGISVPQASIVSHPALHVSNHSTSAVLEFGKSRKLSIDRFGPRKRLLLQKREFFHSQKAQRMELEDVLGDHDSEDEIDDDIADFEDMTMLDGFSDVTKDEKRIMHMWNSFVRKQRVLADGHIPWACMAFSEQHGQELVHNPALRWCWRFVMIKLWNHSLLDARTMNTCNKFLDDLESESSAGPMQT
ncbi:polycomb group protein EMF2B-like isoform X2 [Lolium rigidum]|uniref:polycomb group protein EMF2B-like isoform X2 n=1 Tax=Lolium rigidum TaxID=89674 RepID=UPI001F5D009A|nr:polycomb group protein EMF2B-like isoform X2 [Lolium rigidum]